MIQYSTKLLSKLDPSTELDRIKNGESLGSNNVPYTTEYIDHLISYFSDREEYENCQYLLKYKKDIVRSHDSRFRPVENKLW